MANALADIANAELAQRRAQMTHEPFTPYQPAVEARQGIGKWAQGVSQRSSLGGMLAALASEAQRYQGMSPEELAGSIGPSGGSGLVGMFAGVGAKTANLANLEIAKKLKQQGIPDPEIWKQTGWTLDTPDKIPRFEIPDVGARVNVGALDYLSKNPQEMPKISSVVRHPELYEAYPEARDISLFTHKGSGASYSATGGGGSPSIRLSTFDEPKSPVIHELQHAIQQREGFARGGSPESIDQSLIKEQRDFFTNEAIKLKNAANEFWKKSDRGEDAANKYKDMLSKANEYESMGFMRPEVTGLKGDIYKRLAGEAEARLTQARMNMTPEERLAQYPYQPEYFQQATGVPLSDLIVRNEGGTAMSVPFKTEYGTRIPQLVSDMAEARRLYEAQRAARLAQPEQNTLSRIATGAGALGAGTGLGYYGTEYLLGGGQ